MNGPSIEERERHFIKAGYTPDCAAKMARYNVENDQRPMTDDEWDQLLAVIKGWPRSKVAHHG